MLRARHRELHRYVKEQAGTAYRSSFHYTASDWEAIHTRHDVEQSEGCPEAVQRARTAEPLVPDEDTPPGGTPYARTEIHDDAIVFHFPEDDTSGVLVALDPDAARLITGFATRCLSILGIPDSPQYQTRAARGDDDSMPVSPGQTDGP